MKLYKRQQEYVDVFDYYLQRRECKLLSAEQRQWGKTTILNEIGFTYQSLGYEVFLFTQHPKSNEHFATRYIDAKNVFYETRGLRKNKTIAIIDEYDSSKREYHEIIKFLNEYDIPYVGFVS